MTSDTTTATEATTSETTTESSTHSVVVYIDLWVFVSLMLACLVIHIRTKVNLPTSGLLMLAGILLRCVGQYIGMLGDMVNIMDAIEAETILLIFLPALISECAFQTDWYIFKREFGQIILLASTAVIVSTVLTAIVVRYILGFENEFSWYSALMLGAILSATDHVAVVSQLKEVNAADSLETLIQGETLVNDGTVIVLFTAMMKGAISTASTPGDIAELFFRLSLGGIALGFAFGLALSFWLSHLFNHAVLETLLTLVTTYLLFFTADATQVHFSGALGTVTFGLYMSAYGKTMISPAVEKTVHMFWKLLGTVFESLTLILGGMLMGHFFVNFERLEYSDVGALFGLFALLHVVRAATVLLHWPLLKLMGYGCNYKEMLVLIFGALKGTISIALSLMVFHETAFPERVSDLVLFWSVGVSALSVLFDSVILHFIVRVLGLESLSDVQENMLVSVTTSILASLEKKTGILKNDEEYRLANWDEVMKDAGSEGLLHDMVRATKTGRTLLKDTLTPKSSTSQVLEAFAAAVKLTSEKIECETRRRFFTALKGIYWEFFEENKCFGDSALILIESANRGLDAETEKMQDWDILQQKIFPRRVLKMLHYCSSNWLCGWAFRWFEYRYVVKAYDIARNFVRAHHEAEELLDDMEIDINKEIFEKVMEEAHEQAERAKQFMTDNIMDGYPEVSIFVQTKQLSAILLEHERKSIEEANDRGVVTEIEYSELLKSVTKKILKVERRSTPKPLNLMELLKSCNLFKSLSDEKLQKLASGMREEVVHQGEILFDQSESGRGVFVVLNGRVKEDGKGFEFVHSAGDVVGIQCLMPRYHAPPTNCTTLSSCKLAFISITDLNELLEDAELERTMWLLGAKRMLQMSKELFGDLGQLDAAKLRIVFMNSVINKFKNGADVPLNVGSMLLSGSLSTGAQAPCYIAGVEKAKGVAGETCMLLQFTEEFGKFVRTSDADLKTAVSKFELQAKGTNLKAAVKKIGDMKTLGAMFLKKAMPGLPVGKRDQTVTITSLELESQPKLESKSKASVFPMFGALRPTAKPKEEDAKELLAERESPQPAP